MSVEYVPSFAVFEFVGVSSVSEFEVLLETLYIFDGLALYFVVLSESREVADVDSECSTLSVVEVGVSEIMGVFVDEVNCEVCGVVVVGSKVVVGE